MPGSSDSMYSSYFMLENIWHHYFTWSGSNSQEIVKFVQIVGSWGLELNWKKFTISCEFDPHQVKWWYHMFSSIKNGGIHETWAFWLFLSKTNIAKNIVLRSPGTHFMHIKVNSVVHLQVFLSEHVTDPFHLDVSHSGNHFYFNIECMPGISF